MAKRTVGLNSFTIKVTKSVELNGYRFRVAKRSVGINGCRIIVDKRYVGPMASELQWPRGL